MTSSSLKFPPKFLWGCATSSYQIEGAFNEGGRTVANWDVFSRTPGKVYSGHLADPACDHFHRYKEDVRLMADLGMKAYRFSVAWPRVVPSGTGGVNPAALDFYDRLTDELLRCGIEPFITLYHWDHPQILDEKGGWRNRDFASWFAEYAAVVARRFSDRVENWMTLNEPPCIADLGYGTGLHAPGSQLGPRDLNQVVHHILLAHGLGVEAIRQNASRPVRVGIAHNPDNMVPLTSDDADAARTAWRRANSWWFHPMFRGEYPADLWRERGGNVPEVRSGDLKLIGQPLDFMGLNIYHGTRVRRAASGSELLPFVEPGAPTTTMGWPVIPEAMYWGLKFFHEDYPVETLYITENGVSIDETPDASGRVDDRPRIAFLRAYLSQLHRAVAEGVPVKGYFLWTLMDNFEWSHGFSKLFGLVRVDGPGLRRVPKSSALWYRDVISVDGI